MKSLKHLILSIAISCIIFSCSKAREEEPEQTYYNAIDFYENNKEEEQEFLIESDTGECIVGKKGTIICGDRTTLTTSSSIVELPYTVKLIELYSIKDHILYNFPTSASGEACKNGGTIRLNTYKDDQKVALITNGGFSATYSVDPASTGNSAFKGSMENDTFSNWEFTTDGTTLTTPNTKNHLSLASFGWYQTAQNSYSSSTTIVTFHLDGVGAEELDIWLVDSDDNTVMHGTNLEIENVPTEEEFTAIVIAVNQDDELLIHKSSFTVTANQQVDIEFDETSENALLNTLEGL